MTEKIKTHGFGPVIDEHCEILILGSFPSVKSREEAFYYMHSQNRFWTLLSGILNEDFVHASVENKRRMLLQHHIALYDVLESCEIEGSKDSSISNFHPTDVKQLIKNTKIKQIFLNGKAAYTIFIKHNPSLASIACYLPSTSSANAKFSLDTLRTHWDVII